MLAIADWDATRWSALAAWIAAIGTVGLAVFAWLAYTWTKREVSDNRVHFEQQLAAAERQMAEAEAAHRATLRPEIVVSDLQHVKDDEGYLYTANVRNIGTGPALHIHGAGWCAYDPNNTHTLRLNEITARSLAQQLGHEAHNQRIPDFNILPFALGAGEPRELRFRVSDRLISYALFRISCEDVFGTKFDAFGGSSDGDFVTCR